MVGHPTIRNTGLSCQINSKIDAAAAQRLTMLAERKPHARLSPTNIKTAHHVLFSDESSNSELKYIRKVNTERWIMRLPDPIRI